MDLELMKQEFKRAFGNKALTKNEIEYRLQPAHRSTGLDVMAGKYLDLIVKLQKENSQLKSEIKNLKKKLK